MNPVAPVNPVDPVAPVKPVSPVKPVKPAQDHIFDETASVKQVPLCFSTLYQALRHAVCMLAGAVENINLWRQ